MAYHSEPFNVLNRSCVCGARFKYRYTYVSSHNEAPYRRHLAHVLSRFSVLSGLDSVWGAAREFDHQPVKKFLHRLGAKRALLKDPLAVFSAEWLASTFNMRIVVTIRHPAAVVSSYKSLGWTHRFPDFLEQTELMEQHLWPFRATIEDYCRGDRDIVDQASLLWKLVYHMVQGYRKEHNADNGWTFVRHEDVSASPTASFDSLFRRVGLRFSPAAGAFIEQSTRHTSPIGPDDPYSIRRDPVKNLSKWKRELSASEVNRIRRNVEGVSETFYADADW